MQALADAFRRAWSRYEDSGAATSSDDRAALPPPVTAAEAASLELRLGFPLHPELRTLLRQYDGRHDPLGGEGGRVRAEFLPFGLRLIDVAGIRRHYDGIIRDLAEEAKEDFPADPAAYPDTTDADDAEAHIGYWVPFAADNDRGIAFVDHRPGPTYGYVYVFAEASGGWPPVETAPGLTDLFERLARPSEPA
ncbi:SMI1/KNR4 family protein [Yinghuangia aomiensis]